MSIASLWKMAIKVGFKQLTLQLSFNDLIAQHIDVNKIELLPIEVDHLDELAKLPFHYKDPFDRLMIAQRLAADMTILSRDSVFAIDPVSLMW